jgi:outer membrane protein assembly factor BamA
MASRNTGAVAMRYLRAALLLSSFAPGLAWADTTYSLDKVTIQGNVKVPSDTLNAVVQEKAGTNVTKEQIIADQDAILATYKKANVGMAIKVLLKTVGTKHAEVTFLIDEKSAPPPTVVVTANKLAHVIFVGNKAETTADLLAASGMHPGDVVTNDTLKKAQADILAVYQKDHSARLANVNITGDIARPSPGLVDVTWTVSETKGKKKPRNTDDPGAVTVDQ